MEKKRRGREAKLHRNGQNEKMPGYEMNRITA